MGQQQMLLMILVTIIVGVSIRVGFQVVDYQNMQQNRDQLMIQSQLIYAYAEQYATKSQRQAGGAGAYTNLTLPTSMTQTPAGTFSTTVSGTSDLTIIGTGNVKGNNGTSPVSVTCSVTKRKMSKVSIIN
jgi:hypothetical protein